MGYIYSFCISNICYYGFTNNPERRERQHREKLSLVWFDIKNGQLDDYLNFLEGNKTKYDVRYYKMAAILISTNKDDYDFVFEKKIESDEMSGGGLIEKYFGNSGILNGNDKNINLKKRTFFEMYKSREEVYQELVEWRNRNE